MKLVYWSKHGYGLNGHFHWSTQINCFYQTVFKTPSYYSYSHGSRRKDAIISRIRLQHTKLNGGLHKIGCHKDGLCPTCKTIQNGYHFIMECTNTKELKKKIEDNLTNNEDYNYPSIISNPKLLDIVMNYIIEMQVTI